MIDVTKTYTNLMQSYNTDHCIDTCYQLKIEAVAKFPTRYGKFIIVAFSQNNDDNKTQTDQVNFNPSDPVAIIKGDVIGKENILTRIHSECLTGDALGSLRCDCQLQLEGALQKIEKKGEGIVIYLRQEGRGIGLTNKLRAYELQDLGLNTVEANLELGFKNDIREYHLASEILKLLQVKSLRLMTNNPEKLMRLNDLGVIVTERVEHIFKSNKYNEFYLQTKKDLLYHLLEPETQFGSCD